VPATALHPRSATEIIDASFQLLRQYYPQLVALSVVALLPYMILAVLTGDTAANPVGAIGVLAAQVLCTSLAEAAVIVAASDGYLEGQVDIRHALLHTASRLPSIIGALILRGLAMVLGLIALLVPGVYIALRTFAATAAVVLEGESASGGVSRSWRLGKGEVGKIFTTMLLAWLIYIVLFVVLLILVGIIVGQNPVLVPILTAVMLAFVYPFTGVVTTLLYYDLRVRHEGFDLELLAREVALPPHDVARSGLE
jgi:hypothetical protein